MTDNPVDRYLAPVKLCGLQKVQAAHHIGEPILCGLMLAFRNIAARGKMANGLRLILLKGAFEA